MAHRNSLPLLGGEGAPQGWVRGRKPLIDKAPSTSGTPHPTLRATFSPWEKGNV